MQEIMAEMEPSAHKKHQQIIGHAVKQIAADNQYNRKLHIFREKDMVEFPIGIPGIHVQEGIEADDFPEKNIHQQSAEKTDHKTRFLPSHEAEGGRQDNQQVRHNPTESQCVEYRTLQQKAYNNQNCHHKDSLHFRLLIPVVFQLYSSPFLAVLHS